ncbi:sigma-70 family RNA polymerase sigma factor [Paenibacillus sp. WC2504]|uniref:sigma-70 family RNA polymerase sigma factor n=1 Tax=Paenibacillus sp. WC2504 TaxID=3461403 RepID=UPI004045840A
MEGRDPESTLWNEFCLHCRFEAFRRFNFHKFSDIVNPHLLDRIVHELIGELYFAVQRFDPNRSTFKTYVNGIIDHMVLNEAKQYMRRKRHKELEIHQFSEKLAAPNGDPEEVIILEETITELYQMFQQLTTQQYQVCKLRYVDGFSTEETALSLGITKERVSNRLEKAKKKLEKIHNRHYSAY